MPTEDHQTIVALAALLLWPIVSLCIFASSKNLSRGLIWSVLAAQLLLPVGTLIKFQMIPQIDKISIANFSALIGCMIMSRGKPTPRSSGFGLVETLLLLSVVSPFITSELNPDDIVIGGRFLSGVGLYDAVSATETALILLIPFMLGRRFLRTAEDCREIIMILAIAGLAYSAPLLFEIRVSPQLHYWIYGFFPTDFVQAMREGGYRPMVFMGHGLLAAFFLMTSILAATTLWRSRVAIGALRGSIVAPYLGLVLVLCKSLGALIYGIGGFLLVLFAKPRTQARFATLLVTLSLMYPLLRSFELVPTTVIVSISKSINDERAKSLEYRLDNEDILLRRAFERPLFGWGRFGRSRVYDPESGDDISVTDGRWVIDIGQFGLVGFLAEFGLLAICVYRATAALRFAKSAQYQLFLAAVTLIVSLNVFDLLPNSGLIPWTWLLSGALLGQAEALAFSRRSANSNALERSNVTSAPHQAPRSRSIGIMR